MWVCVCVRAYVHKCVCVCVHLHVTCYIHTLLDRLKAPLFPDQISKCISWDGIVSSYVLKKKISAKCDNKHNNNASTNDPNEWVILLTRPIFELMWRCEMYVKKLMNQTTTKVPFCLTPGQQGLCVTVWCSSSMSSSSNSRSSSSSSSSRGLTDLSGWLLPFGWVLQVLILLHHPGRLLLGVVIVVRELAWDRGQRRRLKSPGEAPTDIHSLTACHYLLTFSVGRGRCLTGCYTATYYLRHSYDYMFSSYRCTFSLMQI